MNGRELISEIQQFDKYARFREDLNRRETWEEVCERVMEFFKNQLQKRGIKIPGSVFSDLWNAMEQKKALPSMRVVQMAGPALERDNTGAYNCAYLPMDAPAALPELLYILMQGCGVGYSVEKDYIAGWPVVQHDQDAYTVQPMVIADSTEGWVGAFSDCIQQAMRGIKVEFDYSQIRPEGAPLKTKGGRASGPEPLKMLLEKTYEIIRSRAGQQLTPFDVHRLATLCGSIVHVGGVRRAALIALFSPDDEEMRNCKNGSHWFSQYPELSMANNTVVYDQYPGDDELIRNFASITTGSGEPGIFNRNTTIPHRRIRQKFGLNPCGEILLRPRQFCNLSIAVARPDDTEEDLRKKVELATIFGTIQSILTHFPNLPDQWAANCNEERLLGVDITGAMDCPLINNDTPRTGELLRRLKNHAIEVNRSWSAVFGIPQSTSVTCNKPSGNSSQLLDCSSGIHPRYAKYYIRRLRIAANGVLATYLRGKGVPVVATSDPLVACVEIPVDSPAGAITRNDLSALNQFYYWLMWKEHWTEHNPSCTIYVEKENWIPLMVAIKTHWHRVGGLSFLPKSDTIYPLAPYEEITEEEFQKFKLDVKIDFTEINEGEDNTEVARDVACQGGICEL